MATQRKTTRQDRLQEISNALEVSRKMQHDWMSQGLDFIHLYVSDWSGDWLERWEEDEAAIASENSPAAESVTAFLEGNDPVAVQVRKRLGERSRSEIAEKLEHCLSLPTEDNQRLFAVKTVLADNGISVKSALATTQEEEHEEVNLLDLAEDLLEKLAEIWGNSE